MPFRVTRQITPGGIPFVELEEITPVGSRVFNFQLGEVEFLPDAVGSEKVIVYDNRKPGVILTINDPALNVLEPANIGVADLIEQLRDVTFSHDGGIHADRLINEFVENAGATNMRVDGTIPQIFEFVAPADMILQELTIFIEGLLFNSASFGGIVGGLTNGCRLFVGIQDIEILQNNLDIARLASTPGLIPFVGLSATYGFAKRIFDPPITLNQGESVGVEIRDDLTVGNLDVFNMKIWGYRLV